MPWMPSRTCVGAAWSLRLSLHLYSPGREVDGHPARPVVVVGGGIEVEQKARRARRRPGVADFALAELAAVRAVRADIGEILRQDVGVVVDSQPDPGVFAHGFGQAWCPGVVQPQLP